MVSFASVFGNAGPFAASRLGGNPCMPLRRPPSSTNFSGAPATTAEWTPGNPAMEKPSSVTLYGIAAAAFVVELSFAARTYGALLVPPGPGEEPHAKVNTSKGIRNNFFIVAPSSRTLPSRWRRVGRQPRKLHLHLAPR